MNTPKHIDNQPMTATESAIKTAEYNRKLAEKVKIAQTWQANLLNKSLRRVLIKHLADTGPILPHITPYKLTISP